MIKIITAKNSNITVETALEMVNDYALSGSLSDLNFEERKRLLESAEKSYIECMKLAEGSYRIQSYKPVTAAGKFCRVKIFLKKIARKCIYWYISDLVEQQTNFNEDILRAMQAEQRMLSLMKDNFNQQAEAKEGK